MEETAAESLWRGTAWQDPGGNCEVCGDAGRCGQGGVQKPDKLHNWCKDKF